MPPAPEDPIPVAARAGEAIPPLTSDARGADATGAAGTSPRGGNVAFETSSRGSNVAVVAVVLALLAAGAILHPDGAGEGTALSLFGLPLPTICWFRLTTGLPCPGCGLTRAIALLMHGRLAASWAMHPFGIAAVGLALLQIPPRTARAAGSAPPWTFRWDRLWAYALVATAILMLAWWVLRIGVLGWPGGHS